MATPLVDTRSKTRLASYLRTCRKQAGLSQKELAMIVGYPDEGEVSRHERIHCVPPFQVALTYEAVFRVPVSELFPAAHAAARQVVESRLAMLRAELQNSTTRGRKAVMIARKLEWMWERDNAHPFESTHAN